MFYVNHVTSRVADELYKKRKVYRQTYRSTFLLSYEQCCQMCYFSAKFGYFLFGWWIKFAFGSGGFFGYFHNILV